MTKTVVVVGAGIAGMATAWLLSQRYHVQLIDKNPYIGGHTNTIDVNDPESGRTIAVDTGFIVYNEPNYPNLVGLLDTLAVDTRPTTMTFSASILSSGLEYAGNNLDTLFAQRRNLLSPRFLKLVYDIIKFNRHAKALLVKDLQDLTSTLGDFLTELNIGHAMQEDYLLPMAGAIWSCPPEQMRAFPASSFARFFDNHGLLNINDRPQWRTVQGGSQRYVEKLLADFTGEVITDNPVKAIRRSSDKIFITLADGEITADKVVIATHADQALSLLTDATEPETNLLANFHYQSNDTYLHTDPSLMPQRRKVWSCWNYLADKAKQDNTTVSVTYWMNALQGLKTSQNYFVSLNPIQAIEASRIIKRIHYSHPIFNSQAMIAQRYLHEIQGQQGTWFAGSYFGYGFHEDALSSAVAVAKAFDVPIPWDKA